MEGEDGAYTLTLPGVPENTIHLSDRLQRIVCVSATQELLDEPGNEPNAALVAQTDGDAQEVLVIELLNPVYEAEAETLTYDARVLVDYGESGLAHLAQQQADYEYPESFSAGSLFIDDCPDLCGTCYQVVDGVERNVGPFSEAGSCFEVSSSGSGCRACEDDGTSRYYGQLCARALPSRCSYEENGWDYYATSNFQCSVGN